MTKLTIHCTVMRPPSRWRRFAHLALAALAVLLTGAGYDHNTSIEELTR